MKNFVIRNLNALVFSLGLSVFFLLGFGMESIFPWGILLGSATWTLFYASIGIKLVPQGTCWAIERLGQYVGVRKAGPQVLCFPGFLDKPREIPLTYQHEDLYVNSDGSVNKNASIDFEDLSAPITAQAWWQIDAENNGGLEEAIRKFLYSVGDARKFIGDVVDASLRHDLSEMKFEEARKTKATRMDTLAKKDTVLEALAQIGVKLRDPKGILITDIILPPELEELQSLAFKGEREAKESANKSIGYALAIKEIIRAAKENDGRVLSWEEAQDIYFRNKGLEAFASSGAHSTFIGGSVADMIQSLIKR
ncbi:MAG: SPFH domain-containing protein [Candidatus Moraniibacteriota bacterium]|nr:MAG: SPFH domain-containing protein [Candidatus Moranbacteria bacterium]